MNITEPYKKKAKPNECWLSRTSKDLWQLVRLIIDTPINIPSLMVSLASDDNKVEILKLMDERRLKFKMLNQIGNAYTSLCILSFFLLVVLVIIGYGLGFWAEYDHWLILTMAVSALPLVISPLYWYKMYLFKEYIRDLDDYIHLIELHSSSEINSEYKSAIIGEYFLRRHTKKTHVTIDLTPNKRKAFK